MFFHVGDCSVSIHPLETAFPVSLDTEEQEGSADFSGEESFEDGQFPLVSLLRLTSISVLERRTCLARHSESIVPRVRDREKE